MKIMLVMSVAIVVLIIGYKFRDRLFLNKNDIWEFVGVSDDKLWDVLAETKIKLDENDTEYTANYSEAVKNLDNKKVSVKGFLLPLEAASRSSHFILSVKTPTCPFCPPAPPNQVIEVFTKNPVIWTERLVTITGIFKLADNKNLGIFFIMNNAVISKFN